MSNVEWEKKEQVEYMKYKYQTTWLRLRSVAVELLENPLMMVILSKAEW